MNVPLATKAIPATATWRDYLALTKPRIISLLLFTTLTAMFVAADAQHHVTPLLFLAVALGGYMAAGAANTLNMIYDRDIDERMKRTAQRPTVTQTIPVRHALAFAILLMVGSWSLLWGFANLLTALLSMAGLAFYVVVYTMWLKRRTRHNIVIGGAAGAFPPLVGWAAVAGHLTPMAWLLFAIIFVWTPAHFWALALLIKDDYSEVGIPMLPVVRGNQVTVTQIVGYTLLTIATTLLPLALHTTGAVYLIGAGILNAAFLYYNLKLYFKPERPQAMAAFHFSMIYLALLFLMLAIDRSLFLHV
jgi:protoheme IX farnesyltransferase